jgi:VanZ family protein
MIKRNVFSIFVALIIMYLSLVPSDSFDKIPLIKIPYIDKIVHFTMYLTLMSVIIFENRKKIKEVHKLIFIGLVPFGYGVLLEVLQSIFTSTRFGSIFDILFNTLGILCSVMLWLYIKPLRKQFIK